MTENNVIPITRRPLRGRAGEGSRVNTRRQRASDTGCPLADLAMVVFSTQVVGFCAFWGLTDTRRTK